MHLSNYSLAISGFISVSHALLSPCAFAQFGSQDAVDGSILQKQSFESDELAPQIASISPQTGSRLVDNIGIRSIDIQFTEWVVIPNGSIVVAGLTAGLVGISEQFFDTETQILTIELDQTIRADVLTVYVDYLIADAAGNLLDGEIVSPLTPIFPSGDGFAGGMAVIRYEVLQGDVDRNGEVNEVDGEIIREALGLESASEDFDPQVDLNDDGFINVLDIAIWANGLGGVLPVTDAISPSVVGLTPDPTEMLETDLGDLVVEFSEPVEAIFDLDRTMYMVDSTGALHVPASASADGSGRFVTYSFSPPLTQCEVYEMRVSNALFDVSGALVEFFPPTEMSGFIQPGVPSVNPIAEFTSNSVVSIAGSVQNAQTIEIVASSGVVIVDVIDGAYESQINLRANQLNTIAVMAISACDSRGAPQIIQVIHDNENPIVFIDFPLSGAEIESDFTDVAGRVSDRLSGAQGLEVLVNGQEALVDIGIGTNGTFFIQGLALNNQGATVIAVQVTDVLGNIENSQITVQRIEVSPNMPIVRMMSGNAQSGQVDELLSDPIRVQMLHGDGAPFAGKIVTFHVDRSNGKLAASPGDVGSQMLQSITDSNGFAQAHWVLGSDAGSGNNRVSVTSRDIAGTIVYCASGISGLATQIYISNMNNQRAEIGTLLPEPLRVWVSDLRNGIADVPVTFTVVRGDGVFENGTQETTALTIATGHLDMPFVLGQTAGENMIEATFPTNPGFPATFIATGIERDLNLPTTFVGTVLDNANRPLGNARMELKVNNLLVGETFTNIDGEFEFVDVPDGLANILADGTTAEMLAGESIPLNSFPFVGYDFIMVPNAENRLPQPVLLPEKNANNRFTYDGSQNIDMSIEGIEGLRFTVQAGTTVTLTDGTVIDGTNGNSVVLTLDQVHFDKIPMPLPDGAAYPFAWTLQPKAAQFDPPVSVTLPNITGLEPGSISYILQWDGEANEFKITAPAQVSVDGSIIVSDPGSGISVAGWGGATPPVPAGGAGRCSGDPNGCGPGGDSLANRIVNFIIPDGFSFNDIYVDFNQYGCDDHDRCYGASGADKAQCDLDFYNGLLSGCNIELDFTVPPSERLRCQLIAYAYYRAMQTQASMDAYEAAQAEAARCEDPSGLPSRANFTFENASTDVTPPFDDFDLDGMEDTWELENNLSPIDPTDAFEDNDQDGVQNFYEFVMEFDPNNTDTDGNGIGDAEEIRLKNPHPNDVLDSSWEVEVGGQVFRTGPFGTFAARNIPVTGIPIQLNAIRRHAIYGTTYAVSDFVVIQDQQLLDFSSIDFSNSPFPRPVSLSAVSDDLVLDLNQIVQLEVNAIMTDGSLQELETLADGTSYSVSNLSIAEVNSDGLLTALGTGTVFVTANNQGTTSVRRFDVVDMAVETSAQGFVFLPDGSPADGAIVETIFGGSAVTSSDGSYSMHLSDIPPDIAISVTASFESMGQSFGGVSEPAEIVAGGLTDAGIISLNTLSTGPLFSGQEYFMGIGGRVAAFVDLNGDGNLDIAATTTVSNGSISVRISNGEGGFFPEQQHDVENFPLDFAHGDLDNDGDIDIVVANGSSFLGLTVLLNDGDGTVFATQNYSDVGLGESIDLGDLDGDGDLDIVATNTVFIRDVRVLFNNGDGTFSKAVPYVTGDDPSSVAIGDLDGDGDLDIAVGNGGFDGNVIPLLNDGSGVFTAQSSIDTTRFLLSLTLGDLDGDGDLDMAFINQNADEAGVLFNNGDGTFASPQQFGVGDNPLSLTLGDLDGDGDLDICATSSNDFTMNVLLNNGDGTFAEEVSYLTGSQPRGVRVGDFDNDGDLDAIAANSSGSISILNNRGNGTFETSLQVETLIAPRSLEFGDMNNDGLMDMVAGGALIGVILSEGNGTFADVQRFNNGGSTQDFSLVDLNGDGNLDIVTANFDSSNIGVLLSDGNDSFFPFRYPVGIRPSAMIVGDFDGDDDLDVFTANSHSDDVSILLNNGDGSFASQQRYTAGDFPVSSSFGDIDGDGDLDIVVGNTISSDVSVLFNNGNGTFADQIRYSTASGAASVSLRDLDSDGDLDMAIALNLDEVGIFLNNGDGTFAAEQRYPAGDFPQEMLLADLDGDADFDIVTINVNSDDVSVLLNNGDGTFASQLLYDVGDLPLSMSLSDLDGDGNLDLAVVNFGFSGSNISVLLGNGDGTFEVQQRFSVGIEPRELAVGDLDGDGDLDIAVASEGENTVTVLFNRRVQSSSLLAGGNGSWKRAASSPRVMLRKDRPVSKTNDSTIKPGKARAVAGVATISIDSSAKDGVGETSPRHIRVDAVDVQILTEGQARSLLESGKSVGFEASLENAIGQRVEARTDPESGLVSAVLIDFDGMEKVLPKIHPLASAYPVAINQRGDVIGVNLAGEGWVWRYSMPGSIESIGSLGGSGSIASFWLGLVAVLGHADLPDGDIRAVLWTPGDELMDLSGLTSEQNVTLKSVLGVLPNGVVIVEGIDRHGKEITLSMALRLTESIVGDIDGNGAVDEVDVGLILEFIEDQNPVGDLNFDGFVNARDLSVVVQNLGQRSSTIQFDLE